jgi:hypothetical protein
MAGIPRPNRTNAVPSPSGLGSQNTGASVAATSGRGMAAAADWTPTVANLFVLIFLELAAFAALRYVIHRVV